MGRGVDIAAAQCQNTVNELRRFPCFLPPDAPNALTKKELEDTMKALLQPPGAMSGGDPDQTPLERFTQVGRGEVGGGQWWGWVKAETRSGALGAHKEGREGRGG